MKERGGLRSTKASADGTENLAGRGDRVLIDIFEAFQIGISCLGAVMGVALGR